MTARLLETYDVLMVLAPLIEARPWQSESGGKLRRFVQGQWNIVGEAEARKMHRCEAQASHPTLTLPLTTDPNPNLTTDPNPNPDPKT